MRTIAATFVLTLCLATLGCGKKEDPAPAPAPAPAPNTDSSAKAPAAGKAIDAAASKITFVGSTDEGTHEGGFKTFTGTIAFDPAALDKATIHVEIDVNSMWTDDDKLTGHLKSPDFFEVNAHPKASFKSTKIEKTADGYAITGDLTIKGKTNTITAPATITTDGGTTVKTSVTINRFDYGIEYGKGKTHHDGTITSQLVAK